MHLSGGRHISLDTHFCHSLFVALLFWHETAYILQALIMGRFNFLYLCYNLPVYVLILQTAYCCLKSLERFLAFSISYM